MVPDPDPEQNCSSHESGSNPFSRSGNKLRIQPNPEPHPYKKLPFFPNIFFFFRKRVVSGSSSLKISVAEPPLFWAAPAPDGQGPGADSS